MLGYIRHGDEVIRLNGPHYEVGLTRGMDGRYITSKQLPTLDEAKAFIDAGKPTEEQK